jgi:ketosteroid isomerase-like protein
MAVHRLVLGVVLMCVAAVSPCLAEDGGARLTSQVTALLEKHDAALAARDVKGVMKTYVGGPRTFLMGTGPGEIYRGKEGIEKAYSQFMSRFANGSLSFTYNWVSAGSRGDMAWFAAEGIAKGTVKGEEKEKGFNVSGTLQKQKGEWRFIAMHFSRLGVEAEPAEETKK